MNNINDGSIDAKTSEILKELKNHLSRQTRRVLQKQAIINMRERDMTYQEIGEILGLSHECVRQIYKS